MKSHGEGKIIKEHMNQVGADQTNETVKDGSSIYFNDSAFYDKDQIYDHIGQNDL